MLNHHKNKSNQTPQQLLENYIKTLFAYQAPEQRFVLDLENSESFQQFLLNLNVNALTDINAMVHGRPLSVWMMAFVFEHHIAQPYLIKQLLDHKGVNWQLQATYSHEQGKTPIDYFMCHAEANNTTALSYLPSVLALKLVSPFYLEQAKHNMQSPENTSMDGALVCSQSNVIIVNHFISARGLRQIPAISLGSEPTSLGSGQALGNQSTDRPLGSLVSRYQGKN